MKIYALWYPPGPQGGSKFAHNFDLKSFSCRTALSKLLALTRGDKTDQKFAGRLDEEYY